MKIITVIGARPQFIKAATVSRVIKNYSGIEEIIVHTGQHYDKNMSEVFFTDLGIQEPKYNLNVGSGLHGKQTAKMIEGLEQVFIKEKPDFVLVYGDTNSTLAGAVAGSKLHIKIAHVEAGLRSYNRKMPEEINRILTDHAADILFAPTQNALDILTNEGLSDKSVFVGDVMLDSTIYHLKMAEDKIKLSDITDLTDYYLATIHRQENTDDLSKLKSIFESFSQLDKPVLCPLHPRTKKYISQIEITKNVKIIDPVGPLQIMLLIKNAKKILTDSGGLQKEAYFLSKPCITLREETEWIETLVGGWNYVAGTNKEKIVELINCEPTSEKENYFGNGKAAEKIVKYISENVI